MGLFRRILREPVFSGNPVLKKILARVPHKRCLFYCATCGKLTILVNIVDDLFEFVNSCDNCPMEI